MATEEKLIKAIEYLKNVDVSNDFPQRNKEKIQNCLYVADTISSPIIRVLPNFHQLLSTTFELLFQMCNDIDSDVRLISEESLNKIIKAMDDENTNKVLIELHREIKKNGAVRSLKAALWRFSNLADLIRLPKKKQYLVNFIPCVINITKRSDELVHETLMSSLPKILKSLGNFLSDNDVKILLESFLKNIDNPSTVIRRTSVNCLLVTCINCRRPHRFLLYLLDILLDLLTSINSSRADIFLILGILSGLKQLILHIKNIENRQQLQDTIGIIKKKAEIQVNTEKLIQVYEICLHFLLCPDDSVMSASLDTLNSLLQNCNPETKHVLISTSGIGSKQIHLPSELCVKGTNAKSVILGVEDTSKFTDNFESVNAIDKILRLKNIREMCYEDINIGTLADRDVSLAFCVRLICRSCLLPGQHLCVIPDTAVRISVKNLALTCLASLFGLYPRSFLYNLNTCRFMRLEENAIAQQPLTDILLFASHSDPQLRGAVQIVIASFIRAVLIESNGRYGQWFAMTDKSTLETLKLERLLAFITKGVLDNSSNCVRQSLTGLNICLKYILNSSSFKVAVPILELLPTLAKNSHWLVTVQLLDVVAELPLLSVYSIYGNEHFQTTITEIVIDLLKSEDQRVRTAATNTIVKIIPSLYDARRKIVEVVAIERTGTYFSELQSNDASEMGRVIVDNLPFPFDALGKTKKAYTEVALSKIISQLHRLLLVNFTDNIIYGYVEALNLLSLKYPCMMYNSTWDISDRSSLLYLINTLLDHEFIYDINCHMHVLQLYGNLLSGWCLEDLNETYVDMSTRTPLWNIFPDKRLQEICELFLNHLVKLLNILVHIIEDIPLTEQKPIINLTTIGSSSPLKSRKDSDKNTEKKIAEEKEETERTDKKCESTKTAGMGDFSSSVHYMKIYDVLKIAYEKYKVTLNYNEPESIVQFLNILLTSLSQILEVATILESSRIADEILGYLQAIFQLAPTSTVSCVHQLLKSLFGSNLVLTPSTYNKPSFRPDLENDATIDTNLYQALVSRYHYENIVSYYNLLISKNDSPIVRSASGVRVLEGTSIKSDKILAGYIRLFEPMVIKSLKHYTMTSNVESQCAVLNLLNQLVRLKVNYCLLDSEQVFIKFIQKQFEFIEEGLVTNPAKLIPNIFEFLTNLSHGKQHSKSIIGVPKVLQLCDGLMASEQAPLTYCVPALRPIAEDLFLMRNSSISADFSELETTREVLLSMMLRLFEYAEVMDLLVAILNECKRSGDVQRVSKLSKQVYDVFLDRLARNNLRLDSRSNLLSLIKLLVALDSETVKSANELLVVLFQRFPSAGKNPAGVFSSWLGKILVILLIIVRLKEDVLLSGIRESVSNFAPESVLDQVSIKSDPLNVTNVATCFEGITADVMFVKFLFRAVELITRECRCVLKNEGLYFLIEQLSHLLLILSYIYHADYHRLVLDCTMRLIKCDTPSEYIISPLLDNISENILEISDHFPSIKYQWCCILAALDYKSISFWARNMNDIEEANEPTQNSVDMPVITQLYPSSLYSALSKSSAVIALCEYLVENDKDTDELLLWFVLHKSYFMVQLCEEPPVANLIRSIHSNPKTSIQFMEAISTVSFNNLLLLQPSVVVKLLAVLRNCNQTGAVIQFLVNKLLNQRHLALHRAVINLTCRKLEYLLTLNIKDIKKQMPKESVLAIIEHIRSDPARRNECVIGLLTKLCCHIYEYNPLEQHREIVIDSSHLRKLEINEDWYLTQLISNKYLQRNKSVGVFSKIDVENVTARSDKYSKTMVLRSVLSCVNYLTARDNTKTEDFLLNESVEACFLDLIAFRRSLPKIHQVYLPEGRQSFTQEVAYARQLDNIFQERSTWKNIQELLSATRNCTIYLERLEEQEKTKSMNLSLITRFCVTSFESVVYILAAKKPSIPVDYLEDVLTCADALLKLSDIISLLTLDIHLTWICSFVNDLYRLVLFLMHRGNVQQNYEEQTCNSSESNRTYAIAKHAVGQLGIVFTILANNKISNVPDLLFRTITSITIRLSRLPIFNSYLSTPSSIWNGNDGWIVEYCGTFHTEVPPLPVELLRDVDILKEYNLRVSHLGWSSRQQFEETWMSLLSTLNSSLIEDNKMGESSICFTIKTVTALLARTFYEPIPGDNSNSIGLFHVTRDSPINVEAIESIKKLKAVQDKFERKYRIEMDFLQNSNAVLNVFKKPNIEKHQNTTHSCGQVCIAYLLLSSGTATEEFISDSALGGIHRRRKMVLEVCGLDLNSCIQSLLDLYSLWMTIQNGQSLKVLDEILKSLLVISDLFQQKSQFLWMLDTCIELSKDPFLENEICYQYLLICMCKAVALLNPDMDIYELIKKILNQFIKSPNLSMRISCLHGLLYLIEGCVLANTVIGGISEELQLLLPVVTEYLNFQNDWNITILNQSREHFATAWALTFFLIENIPEDCLPQAFVSSAIQAIVSMLKTERLQLNTYSSLMKALERLVIKRCISSDLCEHITKLALDKVKDSNASQSLFGVQLLITCMYADCMEKKNQSSNDEEAHNNPDNLVTIVEKVSVVFDRIKKGLPCEVEILCHILPDVINDFFSPADILTKVVAEFLSPQQKNPGVFSSIVFQVFENGIARSHLTLLQDWVVVSLSNFVQSVSAGMATWYLTCFFINTSTNFWLRSIFPYVQSRIGRFEQEDKEMLCIAARDFYHNLTTDKQRRTFVDTFRNAGRQCDNLFAILLESL